MPRVLLAALLTAVLGSSCLAASASARVLTITEHATTDATTDTGAPGDSAGDLLTWHNALFNAADTRRVGRDQGYCLRIVPGVSYECAWTSHLRHGQLMVQGPFYDAGDSVLAITGGTGRYAGARGSMHLHALAGGTKYRFAFHLRRAHG
jgi:allene oxide cyclase